MIKTLYVFRCWPFFMVIVFSVLASSCLNPKSDKFSIHAKGIQALFEHSMTADFLRDAQFLGYLEEVQSLPAEFNHLQAFAKRYERENSWAYLTDGHWSGLMQTEKYRGIIKYTNHNYIIFFVAQGSIEVYVIYGGAAAA